VLSAAPFVGPKFARIPSARLQLPVHRFEVINLEGEGAGLTRLVVPLAKPPSNLVIAKPVAGHDRQGRRSRSPQRPPLLSLSPENSDTRVNKLAGCRRAE
jgi:hypothetical protein